jgi:outer membrane lipase/esterase
MKRKIALAGALLVACAAPAAAQNFNQAIVFGDSNVDSGNYRTLANPGGGAIYNSLWASAVANGAGPPTSSPGLMNSQVLAAYFGLTAQPSNMGGTDYATSGSKDITVNTAATGGFGAAVPTVKQISNYLAANGGHANSNALYLINSGGNDVSFALRQTGTGPFPTNPTQYLIDSANSLATAVTSLRNAGARYFIVAGEPYSFPTGGGALNAAERAAKLEMTQATWSALNAAGINFIPADTNAFRLAIAASPSAFGFQFIDTAAGHTACTQPAGVTTAWALLCSSNPNAPSHLAAPNADQTRLFADDQHYATAGQKIEADYFYSLVVAPSEISFLAENAVQTRFGLVKGIQEQIDIARKDPAAGFNVWINGDLSSLSIKNGNPGFPGDPSTPLSGTFGADYRWASGFLLGGAITLGSQSPGFDLGGGFTQREVSGSVYGGYHGGPIWADLIVTYGALKTDVDRIVPIGITQQSNFGATGGANVSVAAEGGYDWVSGIVTHGPVAGLILQRVTIDGFTESGSFTSLSFAGQTRDSLVSALGYRAHLELGVWRPFGEIVWNHELASTDRNVTASLTTIAAPSYFMPAVQLPKDWASATVGTTLKLGSGFTGLTSFTAQLGQSGVTNYGGRLGLNYAFDWSRPVVARY